jgi:hypothetical protein
MNLQSDWAYILEVAERRLKYNKTPRHIASEKGRLEIIGAAGEVAARRFLGLPERLHNHFDGGVDLNWRGYRIDVKSTAISHYLGKQYLQYPEYRWIKSDLLLMMGIDLDRQEATVIGFAWKDEVKRAPVNYERMIPCHEIPIPSLHHPWELYLLHDRSTAQVPSRPQAQTY